MTVDDVAQRGFGRRQLLGGMAVTAGVLTAGRLLGSGDLALAATPGTGPYGPLGAADANGVQLPAGFTSRVVAVSGNQVPNSSYVWHQAPDGGACFPKNDGGWVYASNAELAAGAGGVGVLEFSSTGAVIDAYSILSGTTRNCAGGPTPWFTWLSCEESGSSGQVYECDPLRAGNGVVRPALGAFNHEAAVVDPQTSRVYLTEDNTVGRLYRFTPTTPGDLSSGKLEAASVSGTTVNWVLTSAATPDRQASTTPFNGGEGAWIHGRSLFFTTKGDNRIHQYGLDDRRLTVLYDAAATPGSPLTGVDNITAHPASGDLLVAEDGGNMELCCIGWVDGVRQVAPFLRIVGHSGSEVAGPAFNPDGTRLYLSSQRGSNGNGVTFEITGPFRVIAGSDPAYCGPTPTTTTTTTSSTTSSTTSTTSSTTSSTTTSSTSPNAAPVAGFSTQITFLQVQFDGSPSSDDDGTVAAWSWNFGDGAVATGSSVVHTYATAGSYSVTLTVTDDDGATDSVTQIVAVTAPPIDAIARDTFTRTTSGGLGTADVGGPWTTTGSSSNFAVNGGVGRITLPAPGATRSARLAQVSARDVEARVSFMLNVAPLGSGGYYLLRVRDSGSNAYAVRLRPTATGTTMQLMRMANGSTATIGHQSLPGFIAKAGDVMRVRLQVTGSPTTTLRAAFWLNADPEPSGWSLQATDSTAVLQTNGGVGVVGYLSSGSSGSVILQIDDVQVASATP